MSNLVTIDPRIGGSVPRMHLLGIWCIQILYLSGLLFLGLLGAAVAFVSIYVCAMAESILFYHAYAAIAVAGAILSVWAFQRLGYGPLHFRIEPEPQKEIP